MCTGGVDLILMLFAGKAAVGGLRDCESCLQKRRDLLINGRVEERERGGLVVVLSHALVSSSCETTRAIALQYLTSLCLKSNLTWADSPLDGEVIRSAQHLETWDLAVFLPREQGFELYGLVVDSRRSLLRSVCLHGQGCDLSIACERLLPRVSLFLFTASHIRGRSLKIWDLNAACIGRGVYGLCGGCVATVRILHLEWIERPVFLADDDYMQRNSVSKSKNHEAHRQPKKIMC